jgi:hypothetical protein
MRGDSGVVIRVSNLKAWGDRGMGARARRGAWGADFAWGRGARGAGLRPRAPLPTLLDAGSGDAFTAIISKLRGKETEMSAAVTAPQLSYLFQPMEQCLA